MIAAAFAMELRLRVRLAAIAALGVIVVGAMEGALYPFFGNAIGNLKLPKGVGDLIGGGNLSTIAGWLKTEIVTTTGPLVVAGVAITCAAATIAGEEESRILALVLAHPVRRARLLLAKAGGVGVLVMVLSIATWVALLLGVAFGGGGIGAGDLAAQVLHLAFLGLAFGALALVLGAATGQRGVASGGAAGAAILMFLINGFAPLVPAISWLKYLTFFYYYSGSDPLTNGVEFSDLGVLAAITAVLVGLAVVALRGRDLRG